MGPWEEKPKSAKIESGEKTPQESLLVSQHKMLPAIYSEYISIYSISHINPYSDSGFAKISQGNTKACWGMGSGLDLGRVQQENMHRGCPAKPPRPPRGFRS